MSPVMRVAQHPFLETDEAADDLDERAVLPLSVEEVRLGDMKRKERRLEMRRRDARRDRAEVEMRERKGEEPHRRKR
jgi:hypothetical protein